MGIDSVHCCSFLELYNEETTDLLAVGERQDQKLRIMEDRSGVVIQVGTDLRRIERLSFVFGWSSGLHLSSCVP